MKKQQVWVAIGGAALSLGVALGWKIRASRADGIPLAVPLAYAGVLENGGVPFDGNQSLTINLWRSATGSATSDQACTTAAANTPVHAGYFRVNLDPACTAAVQATPNLWVEIVVAGTSLGRTPIAPLPFAIEANRAQIAATANAAGGALDTRITTTEGALTALTTRVTAVESRATTWSSMPQVLKASTSAYTWAQLSTTWNGACGTGFHVCTFLEASTLWQISKYTSATRTSVLAAPGGNLWTSGDFSGNQPSCHLNYLSHSSSDCWGVADLNGALCSAGNHVVLHSPQTYNQAVIASGGCRPDTESNAVACCADGAAM